MSFSSIAIKYTLIDVVVFDYISFPIFTYTKGMTHFPSHLYVVIFFGPMPPHVLVDFVVHTPGHGRSVTDF